MTTFSRLNPAFVLYNGHDLGDAVGGGRTIGEGKILPDPLVVHTNTTTNKNNAPWAIEGTKAILNSFCIYVELNLSTRIIKSNYHLQKIIEIGIIKRT